MHYPRQNHEGMCTHFDLLAILQIVSIFFVNSDGSGVCTRDGCHETCYRVLSIHIVDLSTSKVPNRGVWKPKNMRTVVFL